VSERGDKSGARGEEGKLAEVTRIPKLLLWGVQLRRIGKHGYSLVIRE